MAVPKVSTMRGTLVESSVAICIATIFPLIHAFVCPAALLAGVYWEAVDGEDGTVEPQGMFAQTAHDYFIIEDHTHSWFRVYHWLSVSHSMSQTSN